MDRMKDDIITRFEKDMGALLPLLPSGSEHLGHYGKDVLAIAGECREIIDAMDREPAMDHGALESRLKMVSARIEETIQVLSDAHTRAFEAMTSIGNRKRINKAYER